MRYVDILVGDSHVQAVSHVNPWDVIEHEDFIMTVEAHCLSCQP